MAQPKKALGRKPKAGEGVDAPKFPLVKCVWTDIVARDGWHSLNEAMKLRPTTFTSIGFLLEETEEYVIITSHFENGQQDEPPICGSTHCIPWVVIHSCTEI